MNEKIRVLAPAKLNLSLQVYDARPDGFHSLSSLFQTVSLYDEITIKKTDKESELMVSSVFQGEKFDLPEKNTISYAVELFRKQTGVLTGLSVELKKMIPSGAGFGGGSSDGASVLRGLDYYFKTNLSKRIMLELAAKIGSDVPFFLCGGTALITGRGEFVKPVKKAIESFFVIIWPNVHCSTPQAFRWLDECRMNVQNGKYEKQTFSYLSDLEQIKRVEQKPNNWYFINSFEVPVIEKLKPVGSALSDLKKSGAFVTSLTGSGSGVFGIYENQQLAEDAFNKLKDLWKFCWLVQTVSNLSDIQKVE